MGEGCADIHAPAALWRGWPEPISPRGITSLIEHMIEEVARVVLSTSPEPVPAALAPATRLDLADEVVRQLQARFGQHVIYRLSRARPKIGAAVLSTGSLGLDRSTWIGGVPRGKLALLRGG